MSAVIDLLIPHRADLTAIGLRPRDQFWQGIRSEESKVTFDWSADLTVQVDRSGPPPYTLALLPPTFRTGAWDFLGVTGERFDRCWSEPDEGEARNDGFDFESLLRALLDDRQPWAFFFLADDQDDYEEVVRGNVDELVRLMRENLADDHRPIGLVVVNLPESQGDA